MGASLPRYLRHLSFGPKSRHKKASILHSSGVQFGAVRSSGLGPVEFGVLRV